MKQKYIKPETKTVILLSPPLMYATSVRQGGDDGGDLPIESKQFGGKTGFGPKSPWED